MFIFDILVILEEIQIIFQMFGALKNLSLDLEGIDRDTFIKFCPISVSFITFTQIIYFTFYTRYRVFGAIEYTNS